ncbi:putative disease resistance protein RGA1 [Ziziphus jujuba]|uniref:Disease resistance protein RGA1 n=1 Tax=Ziziphus jujuba TaxID=326968 RepID=A0ABM4A2E2_ZIZJJ|nr:putative disease resistance protein RGA1 [Ziziphus jujuba]
MAEGAIISVVASIIRLLGTPAFKELGNFWGHKKKFEKLEKTMSLLEAVIHDAEAKQVDSHQIKHWLQRLEDAVYDVDNLLEEFQTEALRRQVMSGNEATKKVRKTLKGIKDDSIFGKLIQQVHLEPHTEHANNRETHSFARDEEVIGRDDDKKKIIDLLLCSDSRDKDNPSFLPIVGIGGLGKTTLAQFVYNDKNVEKYFHLRMWVCLSGSFELKIILEKMIKSIKKRASVEQGLDLDQLHGSVEQGPDVDQLQGSVRQGLDLDQLQNSLRQTLNGKRYLLLLDDVWNEDREKWPKLRTLLMDGSRGSAVLITTRNMDIAQMMQTIKPYELQGLDPNKSWSLFRKVAFERGQEPHNSNIVRTGEEIVEMCKGVPIAIRTIGSILYGNNLEKEWESFKNNKLAKLSQHQNDLLPTLRLSYDCLASHLKHCFAYCRLFPKDHVIDVQKLIKLWMAQGFVKSSNQNKCLEDIGYGYFVDLLGRSFFQEVEKDRHLLIYGCEKLSHMPSGLGELTSLITLDRFVIADNNSKSKDAAGLAELRRLNNLSGQLFIEKLSHNLQGDAAKSEAANLKEKKHLQSLCLRWSDDDSDDSDIAQHDDAEGSDIAQHDEILLGGLQPHPNLKVFRVEWYMGVNFASWLSSLSNLQTAILMKAVVSSSSTPPLASTFSDSIFNSFAPTPLSRLQALQLLETDALKILPEEIVNLLSSLQNLSVGYCPNSTSLQSGIGNLSTLGSLEISECPNLVTLPQEISNLSSLKSLHIERCYKLESMPGEMHRLISLIKLHISQCPNLESLPEGISNLSSLVVLSKLVSLPQRMHGLTALNALSIIRCFNLKSLSEGISNLSSLIYLTLGGCRKLASLPEGIGNLSSLRYLALSRCDELKTLPQVLHGLTSLYELGIERCSNLESLSEGIANLSSLTKLVIKNCRKLASLPQGMHGLTSLRKLDVGGCPSLKSLPEGIGNLSSLEYLYLSGTSLPQWLHGLTSLKKLSIDGCSSLESLPEEIAQLSTLEWFTLSRCDKLATLPQDLHRLTSLYYLSIRECPLLSQTIKESRRGLSSKLVRIPIAYLDRKRIHAHCYPTCIIWLSNLYYMGTLISISCFLCFFSLSFDFAVKFMEIKLTSSFFFGRHLQMLNQLHPAN